MGEAVILVIVSLAIRLVLLPNKLVLSLVGVQPFVSFVIFEPAGTIHSVVTITCMGTRTHLYGNERIQRRRSKFQFEKR
jgi:hypothetical protein